MKNRRYFNQLTAIALFLGLKTLGFGQKFPEQPIQLDAFIQKMVETQQSDIDYNDLYENLYQLYQNPLDLNRATTEDLRNLYQLSELQISAFLKYRAENGPLVSLYELQAVPYFTVNLIRNLAPFVTVNAAFRGNDLSHLWQRATENYFVFRVGQTLEPAAGFADGRFLGSPQRYYTRYRLQHAKDFSFGFISEKDAGEVSFFDFTTFHAQLQNKGRIKNIILGDYQASFGQGLVFAAGYFVGKGGEPIYTTRRSNVGLRPYNSVVEGGFFRGGAATLEIGKWEITGLISRNRRDGTLQNADSTDNSVELFTSLANGGYHRTESEIAKRGTIGERNAGWNATYKLKNGLIGISFLNTAFDKTFQRPEQPYNRFEFAGKTNTVVGLNGNFGWQNFNFFGEIARSSSGGIGAVGGWVASLSPKVEWAVNLRHYDRNFHSFYAAAFGEGNRPINESGLYSGLKYSPSRRLVFSAFYDRFAFPWLRYLVDAPSSGFDYLLRISYQPNKQHLAYLQFHDEYKGKNLPNNTTPADIVVTTQRQNLLANYEFSLRRELKLQTRVQYNTFRYVNYTTSQGVAVMQDVEGTLGRFQLKSRIAFYTTDDYDSRVYAYENDVLYAVSFPAYYGKGMRYYLLAKWAASRRIDVWARFAQTRNRDDTLIGSGINALNSSHRTDVRLQVRYQVR